MEQPNVDAVITVGVDTVRVADVLESVRRFGDRYLDRTFTDREQASCAGAEGDRARGLAARFAGKEAVFKALRADDLAASWTAIEIVRRPGGWCEVELHGPVAAHARRAGIFDLSVSLTHEHTFATAVVVAARGGSGGRRTAATAHGMGRADV